MAPRRRQREIRASRQSLLDGSESGVAVVELILWIPVMTLVVITVIAFGRIRQAGNKSEEASRDAARAASLTMTLSQAHDAALAAAKESLGRKDITCTKLDVKLTGSVNPGGLITVEVSCTADLSDLAAPFLPGSKTLTATSSAPIESTRSRAGGNSG